MFVWKSGVYASLFSMLHTIGVFGEVDTQRSLLNPLSYPLRFLSMSVHLQPKTKTDI